MLILGSGSPRRKEILGYFTLPFTQMSSSFEEESVVFDNDPEAYVCAVSAGKAAALAEHHSDSIILTADTTVYREGKVYNKPSSEEEACKFLSELVGEWHTVYTGVTVQKGERAFHQAEGTRVLFNPLTQEQIRHYITHTQWSDKAGGYAIQLAGGLIVRKIDGCYYNVIGLPINTVEALLKRFGIELWDYV